MKLNLDSPASQVLSPPLPPWDLGKGSGWKPLQGKRNSGKVSCLKNPDSTFSGTAGRREPVFTEGLLCDR